MANVSLREVYKYYENNETPAVADFNLEIKDKEFVVFVGPSGCGKSTTLRMVAGLEEISYGQILIDEKVVNDVEPKDRDIAMVFQNYALYPHMTVYDNMAFGLKMMKVSDVKRDKDGVPVKDANGREIPIMRHYTKAEIKEKVEEAARILSITEYLQRKPKAMSGGQRQRVAIGRAIVRNPKVFLMDEPLSNLDAKLRNQMRAEILMLRKRINTTFIYVTHDQTEAMTLGDRIVIMRDGFIQQVGTPGQVFDHPENLFVAGFIGTPQMNFFNAKLVKVDGSYCVNLYGKLFPVKEGVNAYLEEMKFEDSDIVLGVRPEHITLLKADSTEVSAAVLEAKVTVTEMMGSELYVHAVVGDGKEMVLRTPTAGLSKADRVSIADGGTIRFTLEPELMHLFDKAKETNLIPINVDME